jgi:hypothetical protein
MLWLEVKPVAAIAPPLVVPPDSIGQSVRQLLWKPMLAQRAIGFPDVMPHKSPVLN